MLEDNDYSFLKKINFSIGAGLFVIFTFLFPFVFWVSKNQKDDQNKRTLTEQVELIVNTLDKYSLKDQYDYILKSLIKLDLVEEVALFSGKCKIERLFPMNRGYNKDCISGYSDDYLVYSAVNSYKDTGLSSILIKMKSNGWDIFKSLISYTLPVFITLILLFILIVFYINKRLILTPIESLISSIEEFSTKGDINALASTAVEIRPIYEAISKKNKEALESQKLLQDKKEKEVIAQAAQQIAHDMKSPISALELILKELSGKNQQYYKIGSMVLQDINFLIGKLGYQRGKREGKSLSFDVWHALQEIVDQKKIEYSKLCNTNIIIDLKTSERSAQLHLDKTEFNVVISNIINNAVQALKEGSGNVEVSLAVHKEECLIEIQVYGHGVEEHENSTPKNEIEFDADGFEIVSTAPSQKTLDKINKNYLSYVKKIFSNKCLSCHGVNDSPPWYYNIPGPKQLMDNDMREAKKHMDMSNDFPFGGHGSLVDDLNALFKTIKKDDMPPMKYRLMHWDSKLTAAEIKVINNWIKESQKILIQK